MKQKVSAAPKSEIDRPGSRIAIKWRAHWRTAHQEASQDLRTRGWAGARWMLYFFIFGGLIYALVSLAATSVFESNFAIIGTACQPDGDFYTNPNDFNYWHISGFFQITLGLGELEFAEAKVIDVIWDVVVGRGGQAILTLVSWHVFAKYVTTSMQVAPVTFNTFRSIFMQRESSLDGLVKLLRDFTRWRGLHSKVAMVFMITSMVFVLAFPTLASAMTGYSGNVQPFVGEADKAYLPFNSFQPLYYVIHDGDRVGKTKEYNITDPDPNMDHHEALFTSRWLLSRCLYDPALSGGDKDACQLIKNVTRYVDTYGSEPQTNTSSFFMKYSLDPPTLNITAYSLPRSYTLDFDWKNMSYVEALKTHNDPKRMAWLADNRIYNATDLKTQGHCQPTTKYNWGFSFIQLVLMIILLLIWIIGTYSMYLRSSITMKKHGGKKVIGEYKAVFELANAMHTQLQDLPGKLELSDPSLMTDEQLKQHITRELRGGSIAFHCDALLDGEVHKGEAVWRFRNLLKKNAWWLTLLVITTGPAISCATIFNMQLFSVVFLPFPVLFAMYVRKSGKSGAVLVFWPVILLAVAQGIFTGISFAVWTRKNR